MRPSGRKFYPFLSFEFNNDILSANFFRLQAQTVEKQKKNTINAATRYNIKRKDERGEQEAERKGKAPQ